ncbi:MAG TPA: hypothetical protein PKI14_01155 [Fervidobacterium sp.]|nr:hypothetical protein [Fervidobacterium sp.]
MKRQELHEHGKKPSPHGTTGPKNRLEYEKQAMIEKYGHCDGLE